jgi:hypothetical protein
MKSDRSSKPRGKPGAAPARGGPRKPARAFGDAGARRYGAPPARPARPVRDRAETVDRARPARDRAEGADPYKPARRPARDFNTRTEGSDRGERFPRGEAPRRFTPERGGFGDRERSGRGFTVTLDPDIARVFRGDASVNRALRHELQLMNVVQGPPPSRGERPARGYQGTPEARGFTRKPRFEESEEIPGDTEE